MTGPTRAFRSELKAELPGWRADALVDDATAARLAERYRLDEPGLDGPGLLPVYVLGALLVGAGVVSLVAWNWSEMSKPTKLAVIVTAVVGAHLAGDALLFLPALLIGAGLLSAPLAFGGSSAPLAAAFAVAGRILAEVAGYALSFKEMARFVTEERHGGEHGAGWGAAILPATVAMVLLGAGIARRGSTAWSRLVAVTTLLAAGAVAAGAYRHAWLLVATGANVLVAVVAVSRLAEGIAGLRRGAFWEGIGLGGLLLVSRFLEIDRLLWLKGLGFIACGGAVTWAAVRFERRRAEVRHAA